MLTQQHSFFILVQEASVLQYTVSVYVHVCKEHVKKGFFELPVRCYCGFWFVLILNIQLYTFMNVYHIQSLPWLIQTVTSKTEV